MITRNVKKLWGIAFGGLLVGVPGGLLLESPATAQVLNPCPSIYQEFGLVRPGCPGYREGVLSDPVADPSVSRPPLPETVQNAVATIAIPTSGLDVRIINEIGNPVRYEALEATDDRVLSIDEDVVLQDLEVPLSLTFFREDDGLISILASPTAEGVLEITLRPAQTLTDDERAVRVQENGAVFVY